MLIFQQGKFLELLNMVQAQPWVGLTCKTPFKCKAKSCLDPPNPKPKLCSQIPGLKPCQETPDYWTWTLDTTGTVIRNLTSNDFDVGGIRFLTFLT